MAFIIKIKAANLTVKAAKNKSHSSFKTKIKSAIVYLACHRLIPYGLADWLIQRGRMSNA